MAGKPAVRAIHARALSGPVARPCLLMRVASQSGKAPGGGSCGCADSARQKGMPVGQVPLYGGGCKAQHGVLHVCMGTRGGHSFLMQKGGLAQCTNGGKPGVCQGVFGTKNQVRHASRGGGQLVSGHE